MSKMSLTLELSPPSSHFPLCHLPDDILHIIISILSHENFELPRGTTRPQTPAVLDRQPLLALSAVNRHLRGLCLPQILSSIHFGASRTGSGGRGGVDDDDEFPFPMTSSLPPSGDFTATMTTTTTTTRKNLSHPLAWLSAHPLATAHVRTLHFHSWFRGGATAARDAATAGLARAAQIPDPEVSRSELRDAGGAVSGEDDERAHRVTRELARAMMGFRNLRSLRVLEGTGGLEEEDEGFEADGKGQERRRGRGKRELASDGLLLLKTQISSGKIPSFSLPSVTSLTLSPHASWLIAHCPNVRAVSSTEWESREDYLLDRGLDPAVADPDLPASVLPWSPPSALIEAAGKARSLTRFEMRGLFAQPEIEGVADAMPGLRELRLDGSAALSWEEGVAPGLRRLLVLERLEVSKLQMHLMNGDWLRRGTFHAMEHAVLPADAEMFVRMVFASLPQLRMLVVEGAFSAEVLEGGGWDGCKWNENQRIRVVLRLFGEEVVFGVEMKTGDRPTLYSVAKMEYGGHVQDAMTVA